MSKTEKIRNSSICILFRNQKMKTRRDNKKKAEVIANEKAELGVHKAETERLSYFWYKPIEF